MALAFIVTLEKMLPASEIYTKTATGKALARESDKLDFAARRKNVTAITSMLSENQDALVAQMIEEGFDPTKMRFPAEAWFPASDGLKTVRGLAEHVGANLNDFKQPNPILRDLKAAEAILTSADQNAVRFHFTKTNL
jgi:hypothetical protein